MADHEKSGGTAVVDPVGKCRVFVAEVLQEEYPVLRNRRCKAEIADDIRRALAEATRNHGARGNERMADEHPEAFERLPEGQIDPELIAEADAMIFGGSGLTIRRNKFKVSYRWGDQDGLVINYRLNGFEELRPLNNKTLLTLAKLGDKDPRFYLGVAAVLRGLYYEMKKAPFIEQGDIPI